MGSTRIWADQSMLLRWINDLIALNQIEKEVLASLHIACNLSRLFVIINAILGTSEIHVDRGFHRLRRYGMEDISNETALANTIIRSVFE